MALISIYRAKAPLAAGNVLLGLLLLVALLGCSGIGSKNINPDRFSYNSAIGQSANEQMLLNLLRIRYKEVPVFLSVSSVLTQYVYSGSAGISGQAGNSGGYDASFLGASAPNSKFRVRVTPAKRGRGRKRREPTGESWLDKTPAERHVAMTWMQRLKRVFNWAASGSISRLANGAVVRSRS
jgi:hypothetical protein